MFTALPGVKNVATVTLLMTVASSDYNLISTHYYSD